MFTRNWQHTRQSLIWGVHSRSFLPDYYDRKTRPSDIDLLQNLNEIRTKQESLEENIEKKIDKMIKKRKVKS